jgi:hypothetical protein
VVVPDSVNRVENGGMHDHRQKLADADVLAGWLLKTTKQCKSAKKTGPNIAAPYGQATALPVSVRVIPKRKKRRTRKVSRATSTKPKAQRKKRTRVVVEEADDLDEEEDESSVALSDGDEVVILDQEGLDQEAEFGQPYDDEDEDSQAGSDEEEDDIILVDEDAEDEDEQSEGSLVEDVIEGEELSDDLGIEGDIYLRSSSDDGE